MSCTRSSVKEVGETPKADKCRDLVMEKAQS